MKPKRGIPKIILTLALAGESLTPYAIAERSGLSKSLVHGYIKDPDGLERLNIVKKTSEVPWRAGLKKANYILSFKGAVEYLDLACRMNSKRSEIKKFIETHRAFYPDFALFTQHESLAQQLGDRIYDWYASTARVMKTHHRPSALTNRLMRRHLAEIRKTGRLPEGAKGIALESAKKGERVLIHMLGPPLLPKEEDEALMHEYALAFLDMIKAFDVQERKQFSINEALRTFFGKTLAKEIEASRETLDELRRERARFKKVQGGEKAC